MDTQQYTVNLGYFNPCFEGFYAPEYGVQLDRRREKKGRFFNAFQGKRGLTSPWSERRERNKFVGCG